MKTLFLGLAIWGLLTLLICIPIVKYIVDKTDNEELAYFVFPIWICISLIIISFLN